MSKIVEVMLHQQWKSKERFNEHADRVGLVVFWVGTALFEARYRMWSDLFEITPLHLGPTQLRVNVPGTIGERLTPSQSITGQWVETFITEKLAPVLTACVDGRG